MNRGDNSVAEVKRETAQKLPGQQEGCGPKSYSPEHQTRHLAFHLKTSKEPNRPPIFRLRKSCSTIYSNYRVQADEEKICEVPV